MLDLFSLRGDLSTNLMLASLHYFSPLLQMLAFAADLGLPSRRTRESRLHTGFRTGSLVRAESAWAFGGHGTKD